MIASRQVTEDYASNVNEMVDCGEDTAYLVPFRSTNMLADHVHDVRGEVELALLR